MIKENQQVKNGELQLTSIIVCDVCKTLITAKPDIKQLQERIHICNNPNCIYTDASIRNDELMLAIKHIRDEYYYKRQEGLISKIKNTLS
jgi:hypothetical protein